MTKTLLFILVILVSFSCHPVKETVKQTGIQPPIIIYKTKKDYRKNVPVTLSDDKTKIASFPSPRDLTIKGELAMPLDMGRGYLLDRRGITKNVAFTSYTYEEYSKLTKTPSADELFAKIMDKKPLKRMYVCGSGTPTEEMINKIKENVLKGDFEGYMRVR
ncbi:MAG: hypothetical protein A2W91_20130 [Bacteroidetes bacterium GWF2_38_335]|nr:MAG: hypothetical protein A2W91_20130 [Bacteroidetes bacterium GWF2_38_335]OFY81973.1 MAG: hypothetical protein A2281_09790 [Bacteroidetes bacterium RIFOXYA12_FULL_38_20]HBS86529.1 hypothetical protein [Bacteroidales bacterium]